MLELKNISISLKKDSRHIVDNFSFTLNGGDKAVIIGEEGNGKSTLLKFIYNMKQIHDYCDFSGDVITKGRLAYLPQMMDEGLYIKTLAEYFGDTEYYMHIPVLAQLGLTLDFILSEQKIGTLSGGEKVKIQLDRSRYVLQVAARPYTYLHSAFYDPQVMIERLFSGHIQLFKNMII